MSRTGDVGLVVGVDTHLDTHTAAVCDGQGRAGAQLQVRATAAGYGELLAWAQGMAGGRPLAWAIEGTRHYGLGLARHLSAAGQQVSEIEGTRHGRQAPGRQERPDRRGPRGTRAAGQAPAGPAAR